MTLKPSLVLPLALAGFVAAPAFAQGSGKNITILRMSGPQLGVRLEEVDNETTTRLKLKEEKGALVTEVLSGSAAEKAGLKKDDVIVKFQGESILTAAQLVRLVRDVPSGRKVEIDLLRSGGPLRVTATLERGEISDLEGMTPPDFEALTERMGKLGDLRFKSRDGKEAPRAFSFDFDEDGPNWTSFARAGKGRLGITYTEIEGQLAGYFKAPKDKAVLVNSVVEDSAAQRAGLKAGDLLVKLGGAAVEDGTDLQDAVRDLEPGKATALTVWREGRSVDLSVTIEADRAARTQAPRRRRPVS